jgi:hypothetical protein
LDFSTSRDIKELIQPPHFLPCSQFAPPNAAYDFFQCSALQYGRRLELRSKAAAQRLKFHFLRIGDNEFSRK